MTSTPYYEAVTETAEAESPPTRIAWHKVLLSDRKVWRDIFVNTVSGLAVIFIAYLAGLGLGLIQSVHSLRSAFDATWLMFFLVSVVVVVNKYPERKVIGWMATRLNLKMWIARLLSILILPILNGLVASLGYMLLWLIFNAINTVFNLHQAL